ncbi:hypothetical protein LSCM1_07705 [Leishmania martiniquensis]|uniref:Phosphate carrier protein, mitochondrial-like protein n=1 Tax=Leishmania martiniquensis TaxID=1580590 RepID=A0A836H570_9TRYP|nr:hypothetical protein LSCM1_07705 [Leishmania martiniquensis]
MRPPSAQASACVYAQSDHAKRVPPIPARFSVHNRSFAQHGSEVDAYSNRADDLGAGGGSTTAAEMVNVVASAALLLPGAGGGVAAGPSVSPVASARERLCFRHFLCVSAATALMGVLLVACVWRSTAAHNIDAATGKVRPHSFQYFAYCFLGGSVVGLVHLVMAPIDILKCRVQVGEYRSFQEGFLHLFRVEASGSAYRVIPLLFRGWLPMLWGYCLQGSLKFSLYEILKYALLTTPAEAEARAKEAAAVAASVPVSSPTAHASGVYQFFAFLFSSCLAETVADLALAPWEAVKIRMQTLASFPVHLRVALPRMWETEGLHGFYKGLVPLWCRQVPYTMMKFSSFECIVGGLPGLFTRLGLMDAAAPSVVDKLVVSMLAGVLAGLLCGVVSHPADTVLSKMNQRPSAFPSSAAPLLASIVSDVSCAGMSHGKASLMPGGAAHSLLDVVHEVGWHGMWKGLTPRLLMVISLTALQWVTYDGFKVWAGLPTTGDAK